MSVSVVVIAKNESRCITRCIESVKPFVDEVVVLDTGSTDGTIELARAAGAVVHQAPWPDDFSVARNQAMALAQSDWCLVMDADEWLIDGPHGLQDLPDWRQDPAAAFVGQVAIDNLYEASGQTWTSRSWVSRLMPCFVRYAGRIHEQPVHDLHIRRMPITLRHDGYLAQQQVAKGQRNRLLLEQALNDTPDDPYLLYQLGKDCEVHDEYEQACQHYERAYSIWMPSGASGQVEAWSSRHDLVARWLFCLKMTRRYGAAMQMAEQELPFQVASPDFFFALGDLLLDWVAAQPEQSDVLLPLIESSWQRCLDIGEAPHIEGAVQGRGSYLAAHNLAVYYQCLGQAEQAEHYRNLFNEAGAQGLAEAR